MLGSRRRQRGWGAAAGERFRLQNASCSRHGLFQGSRPLVNEGRILGEAEGRLWLALEATSTMYGMTFLHPRLKPSFSDIHPVLPRNCWLFFPAHVCLLGHLRSTARPSPVIPLHISTCQNLFHSRNSNRSFPWIAHDKTIERYTCPSYILNRWKGHELHLLNRCYAIHRTTGKPDVQGDFRPFCAFVLSNQRRTKERKGKKGWRQDIPSNTNRSRSALQNSKWQKYLVLTHHRLIIIWSWNMRPCYGFVSCQSDSWSQRWNTVDCRSNESKGAKNGSAFEPNIWIEFTSYLEGMPKKFIFILQQLVGSCVTTEWEAKT